jgi:formylglycine-generating enzyme required for sulfatase activity
MSGGWAGAGFPLPWAAAWGDDECGAWADLAMGAAVQRLRWIEAGEFLMGSPDDEPGRWEDEGPQHRVRISAGFWLADTPCTQGFWRALEGKSPSDFKGDDALPVEQVSWDAVDKALAQLTQQLPSGTTAVLPTEAQWEYAARAGTTTPYNVGNTLKHEQANFNEKLGRTSPVKTYPANAWGLFDCHGNVWEWCADEMRSYAETAVQGGVLLDPGLATGLGAPRGARRVRRGGSWYFSARYARSAYRLVLVRANALHLLGFRFALRSTSPAGPKGSSSPERGPHIGR